MEGIEEAPANIGNIQNVMGLLFSSAIFVGASGGCVRVCLGG